jgi:hypothetical protein
LHPYGKDFDAELDHRDIGNFTKGVFFDRKIAIKDFLKNLGVGNNTDFLGFDFFLGFFLQGSRKGCDPPREYITKLASMN